MKRIENRNSILLPYLLIFGAALLRLTVSHPYNFVPIFSCLLFFGANRPKRELAIPLFALIGVHRPAGQRHLERSCLAPPRAHHAGGDRNGIPRDVEARPVDRETQSRSEPRAQCFHLHHEKHNFNMRNY